MPVHAASPRAPYGRAARELDDEDPPELELEDDPDDEPDEDEPDDELDEADDELDDDVEDDELDAVELEDAPLELDAPDELELVDPPLPELELDPVGCVNPSAQPATRPPPTSIVTPVSARRKLRRSWSASVVSRPTTPCACCGA